MAAYSLEERFPVPKYCYRFTDPGAYDPRTQLFFKQNKYPFLSSTPRKTTMARKPYTQNTYYCDNRPKIPNPTPLMSKTPRFPYEALTQEDLEMLICRCEMECECPLEGDHKEEAVVCQAKVPKRLFKGPAPHNILGEGLSCPSKRDRGFEILPDGALQRLINKAIDDQPFYETRVNWATDFYHGCKWGNWKAKRDIESGEVHPGPADYTLEQDRSDFEKCLDQLRARHRKDAKLLRYVEKLQNDAELFGPPGPAHYSPHSPRGTDLTFLGPKAERFPVAEHEVRPGPAAHSIKRDFDLPDHSPTRPCHAFYGPPPCFGVSSKRFKYRPNLGPGPADYDANVKLGKFRTYIRGAFGVSARRFTPSKYEEILSDDEEEEKKPCTIPTWQFRSRTRRFPRGKTNCATFMPQPNRKTTRNLRHQYLAPFLTSQGRFRPWYDWLPLCSGLETPGPCYYEANKARCLPAVSCGPLFRAPRFPDDTKISPAPNEYTVGGGVETVLATSNKRLKKNMKNQHKFHWKVPPEPRHYSDQEKELMIIDKAIAQLEVESPEQKEKEKKLKKEEIAKRRREYIKRIKCICDETQKLSSTPDREDDSKTEEKAEPECLERSVNKLQSFEEQKPKLLFTFLYSRQELQCI